MADIGYSRVRSHGTTASTTCGMAPVNRRRILCVGRTLDDLDAGRHVRLQLGEEDRIGVGVADPRGQVGWQSEAHVAVALATGGQLVFSGFA